MSVLWAIETGCTSEWVKAAERIGVELYPFRSEFALDAVENAKAHTICFTKATHHPAIDAAISRFKIRSISDLDGYSKTISFKDPSHSHFIRPAGYMSRLEPSKRVLCDIALVGDDTGELAGLPYQRLIYEKDMNIRFYGESTSHDPRWVGRVYQHQLNEIYSGATYVLIHNAWDGANVICAGSIPVWLDGFKWQTNTPLDNCPEFKDWKPLSGKFGLTGDIGSYDDALERILA